MLCSGIGTLRNWLQHVVPLFDTGMEVLSGDVVILSSLTNGHSAILGLVVMLALMPVPTWVAKASSGVQKEKMKSVCPTPWLAAFGV